MRMSSFRGAAFAAFLVPLATLGAAERADLGEVGNYMSRMLQNGHVNRPPFMEMSQRFLDEYLSLLDPQREFFVQGDIEAFRREYGTQLSKMLLTNKAPEAAEAIHSVYQKRVEARIAEAETILDGPEPDFAKDEYIRADRSKEPWPKDEAQAALIWQQRVKEAWLNEKLRREESAREAKEKGKTDPLAKVASAASMVSLHYGRLLDEVRDEVDSAEITGLLYSAVAQSYDPHSDYLADLEMDRFKDDLRNQVVGIGVELFAEDQGATRVTGIVIGGPADRQGALKPDDRILGVDPDGAHGPKGMVSVMFMPDDKVADLVRGKDGTPVTLKVEHTGTPAKEEVIEIVRGKMDIKTSLASATIIQTKTDSEETCRLGIITLPTFYVDFDGKKDGCAVDVEHLLRRLKHENIDGLILDLRLNGGGSLPEVQRVAGLFIGESPVAQVRDSFGKIKVLNSGIREPVYNGPMIVLTDKNSASASEILAGALQDTNRAVIVGQSSTFGKGTVQQTLSIASTMPFFASSGMAGTLKLTIQKFYRPSGSSTQNKGVVPDIVLPNITDAEEIGEAFLDHPLPHDFIRPAPELRALDRKMLFIPHLKELSMARVGTSKDFAWLAQDTAESKVKLRDNRISLNAGVRRKELQDFNAREKARDADRRPRFAAMAESDRQSMSFSHLTLDDVAEGKPLVAEDPGKFSERYLRSAPEKAGESDSSPAWPSSLDLQERESLMILRDMVGIERNARMAGLIKKPTR
jgi:carboxyl-terminal processing protease